VRFQAVEQTIGLQLVVDENVSTPRRAAMVPRCARERSRREDEHEQDEQWQ